MSSSGGSKGNLIETINTVAAAGATETIPEVLSSTFSDITLDQNCTITFPTATAGSSFSVRLRQGGTGAYTVTWPTVKWSSGAVPVLSTAVGAIDDFNFYYITEWNGVVVGEAFA